MRFFIAFLFLLSLCNAYIIVPNKVYHDKRLVKKALANMKQFCSIDASQIAFVCHEVIEGQLFPLPVKQQVTMLRLEAGAFYEHAKDIVAHFTEKKKLIVPQKAMNVTEIKDFRNTYNL